MGFTCVSSRPQVQLFLTALHLIIDRCRGFFLQASTQTIPSSYRTPRPLLHCCADTSFGIDWSGRHPIRMSYSCSSRQGADLLRCGGINASRFRRRRCSSLQWLQDWKGCRLSARRCSERLRGELQLHVRSARIPSFNCHLWWMFHWPI